MLKECIDNCLRELVQKLENDTRGSYYQELFSISQRLRDGELDDSEAASEIYDFLLVSIDIVLRCLETAASGRSDFCRLKDLVSNIRQVLDLTNRA